MIDWLVQTTVAHPDLERGVPPTGLLGAEERACWAKLKTPKRRQDWLLGRWTAKRLLREVIRRQGGGAVAPGEIQVLPDRNRAPVVNCDHFSGAPPALSISHSHRHAFCAVAPSAPRPIGADMERIEPRAAGFVADYFTPVELDLVVNAPAHLHDTVVTAIWSAKEAALKALQLGLAIDTRLVSCFIPPVAEMPRQWVSFPIELDPACPNQEGRVLQGWWRAQDGFVLALAA